MINVQYKTFINFICNKELQIFLKYLILSLFIENILYFLTFLTLYKLSILLIYIYFLLLLY